MVDNKKFSMHGKKTLVSKNSDINTTRYLRNALKYFKALVIS